jgi:ADP-dependent NAD(P)H-hydrate dehydratase / NAD(P)H-hydrate epimerase
MKIKPVGTVWADVFLEHLPPRKKDAHKGDFGHVLVIGGDEGFSGAVRLAGEAAYRTGAGLVSILTHPCHASTINATCPELMSRGIAIGSDLEPHLKRATVFVVGPGLGKSEWSEWLFKAFFALKNPLPKIVDADALNWLAMFADKQESWILTPHCGEGARLLGKPVEWVQANRSEAVETIQRQYGGVCVLKGKNTLVRGASLMLCSLGNPGMATAGMGDVLSGVIGGLLAQGLQLEVAANLGVHIHAESGDLAAERGERGLMASDLMPFLRTLVNPDSLA